MFVKYSSFFRVNSTERQNSKPHLKFTLKLSFFAFLVVYHLPPFSLPCLFKWRGYKESTDAAGLKRKRSQGTVIVVYFSMQLYSWLIVFSCIQSIQLYLKHKYYQYQYIKYRTYPLFYFVKCYLIISGVNICK